MRRFVAAVTGCMHLQAAGGRRLSKRRGVIAAAMVAAAVVALGAASAIADSPPAVTIDSPSEVSYTKAHLSGTVDPQGGPSETFWHFEYSRDPENEGWSTVQPDEGPQSAGSGSGPVVVEDTAEYLSPNTTYYVRLVATNEGNEVATEAPYPSFTTLATTAPEVTIESPSAVTGTSAHFEGTVNPGGTDSAYDSDWHFECSPECSGFEGGRVQATTTPTTVAVDAKLQPNTTYEVRLIAENTGGQGVGGPVFFSTDKVAPGAQTLYAGAVGTDSAILVGNLNPENSTTTYQFEWGTDDTYGNVEPATPQSLEAVDASYHLVTAPIAGLGESTTYHFRLAATNTETEQVSYGEDHVFRTLAASLAPPACANDPLRQQQGDAWLPDCRAYEMVTPPDAKNKALGSGGRISDDGNRFGFRPFSPLPSSTNGQFTENSYVAERGSTGWEMSEFPLVGPGQMPGALRGYDPNSGAGVFETWGGQGFSANLWVRDAGGTIDLLATVPPAGPSSLPPQIVTYAGRTPDFSHILVNTGWPLVPGAPEKSQIYDWTEGHFELLSVMPNGEPAPGQGAQLGGLDVGGPHQPDAFSEDGRRVVFQLYASQAAEDEVYVRQDGVETIVASESQRSTPDPLGPQRKLYLGSSADGNKVLFRSNEELTDDAVTEGDQAQELYEYEIDTGTLRTLSPGFGSRALDVLGPVAKSKDASVIYITARGAMPGTDAVQGARNLYVYHEADDSLHFIATLGSEESLDTTGLADKPVEVTDDGRTLVFATVASLTGDFSVDGGGPPQREFYSYDDTSGELTCVSCGPPGTHAHGPAALSLSYTFELNPIAVGIDALNRGRNLSADGSRFFFDSPDALVPADANGRYDVYEYDFATGALHLISPGDGVHDAVFLGSSASGDEAMIGTDQRLLQRDVDEQPDVYAVRVGGGFPEPPPGAPPCEGEGCQGEAGGSPSASDPGTAGFEGPGNRAHRRRGLRVFAPGKAMGVAAAHVTVRTPSAGRITVSGKDIAQSSRGVHGAGRYRLALKLDGAAKRRLGQSGRLRVRVRVTFAPPDGAKSSAATTVTVKTKQGSHR